MSSNANCRKCGSFELEIDPCRGDTVCTNCGIVLEDSVIISEVQFEENAHGGSSAIGQFVSSDSKGGGMSVIGSYNYGLQKESKEITLLKAKNEISRMCQQLRISQHCLETALGFYKRALSEHLTKGRRSSLVCAACLYIACRLEKTPHLLIDFSDVLQVNPFVLGRTFTNITQALYITLPLVDPCLYVLRYTNQMNLGEKTHEVCTTALRILKRMKKDFLHCGRRPSGLCGAALILATRFHDIRKSYKEFVNVVHIQEVTLKKRLIEFGETPSSTLTTDEFLTVDLGEEQDPPSFKAARLKDKERLLKFFDMEYEMKMKKLQRLIEKQLEKKRLKGKRCSSTFNFEKPSTTNIFGENSSSSKSKDVLTDIIKDNLEGESDVVNAVIQTTMETIDNMYSTYTNINDDSEKGMGPTLETIGIHSSVNKNPTLLDKDGNEQGDENLLPVIDNASLEDLDDEELDGYIVTEEESRQKRKSWMKLYATYIEQQKKKDEERLIREKDGKLEKKKKRPRRTKTGGAATAGEAVEKVLREKKISAKLNYDVLKSLSMDDFVRSIKIESSDIPKVEVLSDTMKDTSSAVLCNTKEIDNETMENEDDYDENDDYFDEEKDNDTTKSLSVSNILRREYMEDEDYYEEYDL